MVLFFKFLNSRFFQVILPKLLNQVFQGKLLKTPLFEHEIPYKRLCEGFHVQIMVFLVKRLWVMSYIKKV